jgi:transcriptional regulator with XRE-family HTH domain
MNNLQSHLSAMVRDRLTGSGVTQADAAAYLGISQKHLSQMLTGAVEGSLGMWDRLLTFTNVDLAARDADLRERIAQAIRPVIQEGYRAGYRDRENEESYDPSYAASQTVAASINPIITGEPS